MATTKDLVASSVLHLQSILPLQQRQSRLPAPWKTLHRAVIQSMVTRGRPPTREEVAEQLGADGVDAALAQLGADDLVVLSADRRHIVGAYPVTSNPTPHRVAVNGQHIYAMCAVDALSVAPMYNCEVRIQSQCRVDGSPVQVQQSGMAIIEASPAAVLVGVRWQAPVGSAASSLCQEMVFLHDEAAAQQWHGGDRKRHDVYTLEQAVAFGAQYFLPLVRD